MRISEQEKLVILQTAKTFFGDEVYVYLFGSRVHNDTRGGDIDIYIKTSQVPENRLQKKIYFLTELKKQLGDQKIDLILSPCKNKVLEGNILRDGIRL